MGPGNLVVRIFEKESMKNSNVIDDFIDACNLPSCSYTYPKHKNGSLSKAGLMLLNEINRYVPRRWINKKTIPSRALLTRYIQSTMRISFTKPPYTKRQLFFFINHHGSHLLTLLPFLARHFLCPCLNSNIQNTK